MKVNIIQEDDSMVEAMVVNFNPDTQHHYVIVNLDTLEGDAVPLADYPDAYQVGLVTGCRPLFTSIFLFFPEA